MIRKRAGLMLPLAHTSRRSRFASELKVERVGLRAQSGGSLAAHAGMRAPSVGHTLIDFADRSLVTSV